MSTENLLPRTILLRTVVLKNVDPKSIHQQILQLESLQKDLHPDDVPDTGNVGKTLNLLHQIEDELRREARSHRH